MKKRILTVLLAGVMCFSMTTAAFAAETDAAASETAETTEMKLLGEDAEGAFHVALKNSTGKDIKEVKINVAKKVEYKDAENLLKEDDIFKADEERLLCCVPLKEEKKKRTQKKTKSRRFLSTISNLPLQMIQLQKFTPSRLGTSKRENFIWKARLHIWCLTV